MPAFGAGFLAAVAVRTAVVFLALVVGLRLTGKRQAGEMNPHDLLVLLLLANAVQNAMTYGNGRLSVALASAGTLIGLGWLFAALQSRRPALESWTVGVPVVLVENGRMIRRIMRQEGVTREDLLAAVREQEVADLSGVKLAILEVDGTISVVAREGSANRPPPAPRRGEAGDSPGTVRL